MLFTIMKSDINKLVCVLFVHLSSIILENFKEHTLIILEIFEFIELHTYKFGLVYSMHNGYMVTRKTEFECASEQSSWDCLNVGLKFLSNS